MNFIDWVKLLIKEDDASQTNERAHSRSLNHHSSNRPSIQDKVSSVSKVESGKQMRSSLLSGQKLQELKQQNKMQFTQLV